MVARIATDTAFFTNDKGRSIVTIALLSGTGSSIQYPGAAFIY